MARQSNLPLFSGSAFRAASSDDCPTACIDIAQAHEKTDSSSGTGLFIMARQSNLPLFSGSAFRVRAFHQIRPGHQILRIIDAEVIEDVLVKYPEIILGQVAHQTFLRDCGVIFKCALQLALDVIIVVADKHSHEELRLVVALEHFVHHTGFALGDCGVIFKCALQLALDVIIVVADKHSHEELRLVVALEHFVHHTGFALGAGQRVDQTGGKHSIHRSDDGRRPVVACALRLVLTSHILRALSVLQCLQRLVGGILGIRLDDLHPGGLSG